MITKAILMTITIMVVGIILYFVWRPAPLPKTGTRSYYAKDRYLVACVHGEYLGGCFIPSMDILGRLNQEQIDSIVLVETIPDKLR